MARAGRLRQDRGARVPGRDRRHILEVRGQVSRSRRPASLRGNQASANRVGRALGKHLRSIGFDARGLERALGGHPVPRLTPVDRAVALRRLQAERPLRSAIRLWYLGDLVDSDEAAMDLPRELVEELMRAGLLTVRGVALAAAMRIVPFGEVMLAHDREDVARPRQDHVVGLGGAPRLLAALTVRRTGETALDLGTGCGVQAVLLAAHGTSVIATDINPRALWFARLNAALNGIRNIETREGDLFQPVDRERFDLVVSNPPFVISPDASFLFRDSGVAGDELSAGVVRGAAEHLEPNGYATLLVNWVIHHGQAPTDPPRSWLGALACDGWILHYQTAQPLDYAATWTAPFTPDGTGAVLGRQLDRWLAHYRSLGADAIGSGAIILRKRTADGWIRTDEMRGAPPISASAHIQRVFNAVGRFRWPHDRRVLNERFELVDGHRLEQRLAYQGGRYHAHDAFLLLDDGVPAPAHVPADLLQVIFALDGTRPLGSVLDEVLDGEDMAGAAGPERRERALEVIGQLFESGYVQQRSATTPG